MGFMYGIEIFYAYYNNISGSNIVDNYHGICLDDGSSNNIVSWNIIAMNVYGILSESSSSNIISENIITNNGEGICLLLSSNNILRGNRFVHDGLFVAFSYGNVVEDNLVNGKPLVYLEGVSDVTHRRCWANNSSKLQPYNHKKPHILRVFCLRWMRRVWLSFYLLLLLQSQCRSLSIVAFGYWAEEYDFCLFADGFELF